jgi:hypothetical protein
LEEFWNHPLSWRFIKVRCKFCGEQWDFDSLHEEVSYRFGNQVEALREKYKNHPDRHRYNDPFQKEYEVFFNDVREDFYKAGCAAIGGNDCRKTHPKPNSIVDAMQDLLGDDMDGLQATMEDMEYLGLDLGFDR